MWMSQTEYTSKQSHPHFSPALPIQMPCGRNLNNMHMATVSSRRKNKSTLTENASMTAHDIFSVLLGCGATSCVTGAQCLTFQDSAVVPSAASFKALTLTLSPTGLDT